MNPDPAVPPADEPVPLSGPEGPSRNDSVLQEAVHLLDISPLSEASFDISPHQHVASSTANPPQVAGKPPSPAHGTPSIPAPGPKGHIPPATNKPHVHKPPPPAAQVDLQLQFPNGSVGKPYDNKKPVILQVPGSKASEGLTAVCDRIEGLIEIGLHADLSGNHIRISGTPSKAGDHTITVVYTIRNKDLELGSRNKLINITVNPDPQSLWKDLEPEPDQPFAKDHTLKERLAKGMVLLGASRRGRSHAHDAKFREDDFRLGLSTETGWYYMAVADGAGSANLSRRGSELACVTACREIVPHLATTLDGAFVAHVNEFAAGRDEPARRQIRNALYRALGGVAHSAFRALGHEAETIPCATKDLATTLNFTICRRISTGWFVAAFAVGDGGVALYRPGQSLTLNLADSGEFAGQTRFLTMSEIMTNADEINKRIQFEVVSDLKAVIAMTDGVSDPMFATDKNFADPAKWDQLWAAMEEAAPLTRDNEEAHGQLLDWLNFWSTGNHDDRTIAIMLP